MFVWIQPDGAVRFLYEDAWRGLLALGAPTIRRASHVEPTPDGHWTADLGLMGGPRLGPFERRAESLDAEHAWLVHHFNAAHSDRGDRPCDPSRHGCSPLRSKTEPRAAAP
jgi:hypothetical protein